MGAQNKRAGSLKIYVLMATMVIFAIAGCSVKSGTFVSDQRLAGLQNGVTKKQEVVSMLGGPQDTKMDGNRTILVYDFSTTSLWTARTKGRKVTFIFENDVLKDTMVANDGAFATPMSIIKK